MRYNSYNTSIHKSLQYSLTCTSHFEHIFGFSFVVWFGGVS